MDENNRHGFEPRMFATFMLYGTVVFGIAWLIATPVAFGQEGMDSPRPLGVAPGTDGRKDTKKKAGESGDYKDMKKKPNASVPSIPASRPEIENTTGPGNCPVNPCTPPTNW